MKIVIKGIVILIVCLVIAVAAYVAYILLSYYRIGDTPLTVQKKSEAALNPNEALTVITYNIGFGAYSPDFDFFMDGGTHGKAFDQEDVLHNTKGAATVVGDNAPDFVLLQEVDTNSTRSYGVNQYDAFASAFSSYDNVFAENFHMPFLLYPFHDPHGSVKSGIATFSKYALDPNAMRYELLVTDGVFGKLFDLDRCFSVCRTKVADGKELVMVNVHLSAYDEGGVIRAAQLKRLQAFMSEQKESGNYLILGGDFNHDLISTFGEKPSDYFTYDQTRKQESWVQTLPQDFIDFLEQNGFTFYYPTNAATCRSTAYPYQEGLNAVWVIDGFIASDNISVLQVTTLAQEGQNFLYSDHNPVMLQFKLEG